jgi:hypothetical protein
MDVEVSLVLVLKSWSTILCVLLAGNRQRGLWQISENNTRSGPLPRRMELFGLTPGARIDLEEPARALRSMICRMDGGEQKARNGKEGAKIL